MSPLLKFFLLNAIVLVAALCCRSSVADEVIIDHNGTKVGDFDCSNCESQVSSKLDLNLINGEMTAGDLWQKFNRKGVESVERLTFYVSLEQTDHATRFSLAPVEFQIDDFAASLGGKSLLFRNDGVGAPIPVAKLELDLPYDFMEVYNADSKVPIKFVSADGNEISQQAVSIDFESRIKKSHIALVGFALFWIAVFVLFNRLTKPVESRPDSAHSLPSPPNRQALSA